MMSSSSSTHPSGERGSSGGGGSGGGPCGACKFLRRKCVKGCIFAPYFDADQGTAHFAAVHKVFGASNAAKLLMRIPPHHRLDAVVTLCYEALARVRDPVYGCVGHIFTLQQQVVSLQGELAYIQARLATLRGIPLHHPPHPQTQTQTTPPPPPPPPHPAAYDPPPEVISLARDSMHNDQWSDLSSSSFFQAPMDDDDDDDDGNLQVLAREFVSRYLPGVRFSKPPS